MDFRNVRFSQLKLRYVGEIYDAIKIFFLQNSVSKKIIKTFQMQGNW